MNEKYTKIKEEFIKELNSNGILYIHNKSGARICCLSNDDNNKSFSITFRTPPNDNTGLPHILEHSVLCGSRKFPVKDPFVQLAKGSLNTFLNAMTFSDKTMYPIASCNDKDFENLMDVYLDAVFYPDIYNNPMILEQEGWHYELNNESENIIYKGVVYNEMKGAFSSPEQILFRKIQQSLFPDNAYGFESGGDPEYIPDLTYDDFISYHKTYYHPSNSYIFLYGDCNMEEKLNWLDEKYLDGFENIEVNSKLKRQEPYKKLHELKEHYPISQNEEEKDNAYLALNYVAGDVTNNCEYYGLEILEYILLEAPGAPLKEALIDSNIGKDVFGSYDNGLLQPTFSIVVKNTEEENKEKFIKIVNEVFENLSKNGLDRDKIESAINYYEFKAKEADYGRYPKGVIYAIKAMDSWLYGGDPFEHFRYDIIFRKLREGIENGCFNTLINKYFINNTHKSLLILKPDKTLLSRKEKEVEEKLKAMKESLTKDEIKDLIEKTVRLNEYQNQEDSVEDLEKIPLLKISDINKNNTELDIEIKVSKDLKIIKNTTFTNNIVYLKLAFDTKKVPKELVSYVGLITKLLTKMSTNKYDYIKLSNEINTHTGGIKVNASVYGDKEKLNEYNPKIEITGKAFSNKTSKLFELIKEILNNTSFEDEKRLKELIIEAKSRLQMTLNSSGHTSAATRAESYFSNIAIYRDKVSGIDFFSSLKEIESLFEKDINEIINNLNKVKDIVFRPENLILCFTGQKEDYDKVEEESINLRESIFENQVKYEQENIELVKKNEGFMTPNKIQYVAKAGNFLKAGYEYSGELKVLQTIISLEYLWNNVRVKGGAYGAMVSIKRNGDTYLVSYRDPNLKETLAIYDGVVDFIRNLEITERELTKYVIGTISNIDQPLTPAQKMDKALSMVINGITNEDLQKERNEVLSITPEKLKTYGDLLESVMEENNICIIGNENKIDENKEIFNEIKHLF